MGDTLDKILANASSGMSAQSIRMNTIASNLSNAGSLGSSNETTYHKKYPIFSEVTQAQMGLSDQDQAIGGVRVSEIKKSTKELDKQYQPNSPMANAQGYVYLTDVNPIEEMTNMISASKEYEANVELMNTTKGLMQQLMNTLK